MKQKLLTVLCFLLSTLLAVVGAVLLWAEPFLFRQTFLGLALIVGAVGWFFALYLVFKNEEFNQLIS